ncbi:hypothetical protein HNQ92_002026 [Rhabdobacter roseus]|uniref:DUF3575 domain-containing protein n=1 Tax=Rhabdobacter roseus TaxID=1655419 RepID=A0A840TVC0_9BACT|nr:hypothetical protein [Rhabdobacter roseus]MBB5283900.1 hypothetical protein [Rhabdobacter roseus]
MYLRSRLFYCSLFMLVLGMGFRSWAQGNVGLRFVFGTVHPNGSEMAFLMPHRLDSRAVLVANWGFIGSYQHYLYRKRISIKIAQGMYSDCAKLFAGHTHLGFRLNLLNGDRHYLELGFGPTFVYRETWHRFPEYRQENKYLISTDRWQKAFVWYGGEVEYDYRITPNVDLTLNAIPGFPDFITFAVGARYWLRPIPSNRDWPRRIKKQSPH